MGSFWDNFGIMLGSFWDRFGIILGSFWDRFGIMLGSFWDRFEIILASFWDVVFKNMVGPSFFYKQEPASNKTWFLKTWLYTGSVERPPGMPT